MCIQLFIVSHLTNQLHLLLFNTSTSQTGSTIIGLFVGQPVNMTVSDAALTDYETLGFGDILYYVKIAMVYWNACILVAVFILRTSLSAALLTIAAGLSGCAIKGKLHHETGFSSFEQCENTIQTAYISALEIRSFIL